MWVIHHSFEGFYSSSFTEQCKLLLFGYLPGRFIFWMKRKKDEKEQIRISAKNLGQLALPNYCPKCFYIKLKLNNKLPWQIFPGIFSSIDSYSKKITWAYYAKYGKLPKWFAPFGEFKGLLPIPHWSKFSIVDSETGIRLTGVPDDIFIMSDGRYFIIDYKTAKYTDNQDKLLGMYRVQLNGYAMIFEKLGMGKVGGLGLVYYEPQGDAPTVSFGTVVRQNGFVMPFRAHLKMIDLDSDGVVKPLLKEVREMVDRDVVPEGRVGCQDCRRMGEVVGMVG